MNSESSHLFPFVRSLLSAAVNTSLYSVKHPQVEHLAAAAFSALNDLLATSREISLAVIDSELIFNGEHQAENLTLNRFADLLAKHGIGHLKFTEGIAQEEVTTLICALSRNEELLNLEKCPHVRFGTVEVRVGEGAGEGSSGWKLPHLQSEELGQFLELYEAVKRKKKLRVNGVVEIVSRFIEAFQQEGTSLLVMSSLRTSDEYTFTHSTNVCILNLAQAKALGISGDLLHDIGTAAMLHDIGKLFVPEEILTKPGKLTQEEFAIMQDHPVKGARYLLDCAGVPRIAVTAAYEHHMKYNCSGYPTPPQGWVPNLCSQLTMISDFFDALRTRRPYREPVSLPEVARLMMDLSGIDFHPLLTRNFLIILQRIIAGEKSDETSS